ncbi:bucky ball [Stigmatopora nigra]
MEDGSKPPHSCNDGQQRNQHPRPFFYVQAPSQPYYLYQHWQMNNPFNHYGVPTGFNMGRPYMAPFQYMPYPGFVFPPSPLHPMDYRRTLEPRFFPPTWNDVPRPPHIPHPQDRRETATSEVQTDPSDPLSKLMECLDKIRVSDLRGPERELDSGVASHSSGLFSPDEEKKSQEQGAESPLPGASSSESPAVAFGDSTAGSYIPDLGLRSLETLNPGWSDRAEMDIPLDSSSLHEDGPDPPPANPFLPHEKSDVTDTHSDNPVAAGSDPKPDPDDIVRSLNSVMSPSPVPGEDDVFQASSQVDPDYRVLQLPWEGVLASTGSRLSSPSTPYYYQHQHHHHRLSIQNTHERMSVLSPSLDELSSRDEMFSTDLDDVDLFPSRTYSGRKVAGVDEGWLPHSNKFLCACCGKNLPKSSGRNKSHHLKTYRDEPADSEEDSRFRRGSAPPRKHPTHRKPHSWPPKQPGRLGYKRNQYKDPMDLLEADRGLDDNNAETVGGELQYRTCQDRLYRDEQNKWVDGGGGLTRRRQGPPLQQLESTASRKLLIHQRPRDDDDDEDDAEELPSPPWDRG